jgi:chromate transporter
MRNALMVLLAAGSFALLARQVPFPVLILGAGLLGCFGVRLWPEWFAPAQKSSGGGESGDESAPLADIDITQDPQRESITTFSSSLRTLLIGLAIWSSPVVALGIWLGWQHTLVRLGWFFSKAAVMTFGGAYAILPYVGQQAVEQFGWVTSGQMMDGLGLAETTPGPLIMVLQFVGFLAAWQKSQGVPPLLAATLGAGVTTWVTFVPCFLWIFLGAPYVERLRGNQRLSAALSAITATVVGVIAHLAWVFGRNVLYPPSGALDWIGLGLMIIGFIGLVRWKWNVIAVVLGGATCGLARHALG